jgi:hypothetical protein
MEIRTGQGGFFVSAVSENRACLDVLASFLQPFCLIEIKDQGAEEDIGPEEQKIAACESYGCGYICLPKDGFSSPMFENYNGKIVFFLINHGILRLSRILNDFNVVYGDFICAFGFHFAVTVAPWP